MRMTRRQASIGYSQVLAFGPAMPAFATRMSIGPCAASQALAAWTAASASVTSTARACTLRPTPEAVSWARSPSRSQISTVAPLAAKRSTTAWPMPCAPPVTMATWPLRSIWFMRRSGLCPSRGGRGITSPAKRERSSRRSRPGEGERDVPPSPQPSPASGRGGALHRLRLSPLLRHDAELLLQARRRGGVLEGELLLREDVAVHLLGRERALVEAREDELQLARIMVDVADREDAGHVRLEFLGVDRDQVLVEVQAPVGDRPELHGQAEEGQHHVRRDLEGRAVVAAHDRGLERRGRALERHDLAERHVHGLAG